MLCLSVLNYILVGCPWEIFRINVCTHTHSSHKHKEICNHVLKGKKSSTGLNFNNWNGEEKTHKVLKIESFERDYENAQYASFKLIVI